MRIARPTRTDDARDEWRLRELARQTSTLSTRAAAATSAPMASLYQTVTQPIPNQQTTTVVWNEPIVDTHGGWTAEQPTCWTAPTDGLYLASASVLVFGGGGKKGAGLRRNGLHVRASGQIIAPAGVVDAYPVVPAKVIELRQGDYVEVTIYQDSGSAQSTYADPDTDTPSGSGLDISWLRPIPGP